jgi:hypothetical protein
MIYKILDDFIIFMHLIWILFIFIGFVLTLGSFFWKKFLDRWLFRTLHLCGIVFAVILTILGKYCPLTMLENTIKMKYNSSLTYKGSFIIHYIEKLVYPNVNPLLIEITTIFIAVFTIMIFIIRPPKNLRWKNIKTLFGYK